jgi:hypothetical protein
MNEKHLTSSSVPLVSVRMRTLDSPSSSSKITNGDSKGNWLNISHDYIKSAEFDGYSIGSRKGNIQIIDPEGWWTKQLAFVGGWKNKNPMLSNMIITYGWTGLAVEGNRTQTLDALLLRTGFGMTDDGVVTINLEFVENIENAISTVQFKTLNDMVAVDPESSTGQKTKNMRIDELLAYICSLGSINDKGSITQQLDYSKLSFVFEKTSSSDQDKYGSDGRKIKIRIGDSLIDKINQLIAWAKHPNPKSTQLYSYEMIKKVKGGDKTVITYGWRPAPNNIGDNTSVNDTYGIYKDANGSFKMTTMGVFYWKTVPRTTNSTKSATNWDKILLSFDLDLKMMDFAYSMVNAELYDKLGKFEETTWDTIEDNLKNINPDQLKNYGNIPIESLGGALKDKNLDTAWGWPWDGAKNDTRKQVMEEFNSTVKAASTSVAGQMAAIIKNNLFTAKATVMGDPDFGTIWLPFQVSWNSDFSAQGVVADMFSKREWILKNARHKFEEGKYTTELELMSIPNMTDQPSSSSDTTARSVEPSEHVRGGRI